MIDKIIRIISLVLLLFIISALVFTQNNKGQGEIVVNSGEQRAIIVANSLFSPDPVLAVADYVCDGVNDDAELQLALDALSVGGGRLIIYAGNYKFLSTVTRNIDNIVIEGVGKATNISYNGITPCFSAGARKGWSFQNISFDAGGVDVSLATEWLLQNVWIDNVYIAQRADFSPANGRDLTTKTYVDGKIPATLPSSFVNSSGGAGDSGKGVILNGTGKVDSTMLPSSSVDNITIKYTLQVQAAAQAVTTDSQTLYWGSQQVAPSTTADRWRVYIPKSGTIRSAYIYSYAGTAGTNSVWSMYVRLNNTSDTLIQTLGANTNDRVWSSAALDIAVTAGDYIEIKEVQPAWGTNPADVTRTGVIYIE